MPNDRADALRELRHHVSEAARLLAGLEDAEGGGAADTIDLSDKSRWITAAQAAHLANVTDRTIWRWVERDPSIAVRAGGRTWIDRHRLFDVRR